MNYLSKVSSMYPPSRNNSNESIVVLPFKLLYIHVEFRYETLVRSGDDGEIGYEDGGGRKER